MVSNNTYPYAQYMVYRSAASFGTTNDPVSEKRNCAMGLSTESRTTEIRSSTIPSWRSTSQGDKKGQAFKPGDEPIGNPVLDSPVHGMTLDFGQVALGNSAVARLYIKGESLRGNLDLLLYSGDRTIFSIL